MGEKDIVSNRIVRQLAVDLATYLLKLDINADSLELLETERQRVEDRQADLVARVRAKGADEPFVLHIEIQNNNDPDMAWRMLRYLSDIRLAHRDVRVRQHLIYIGRERLSMPAGIDEAEAMLTQVDVEKLPSYELGMEKGIDKGMEKGAYLERRRLAKGLLDLLPDHVIAEKTSLSLEAIQGLRSSGD